MCEQNDKAIECFPQLISVFEDLTPLCDVSRVDIQRVKHSWIIGNYDVAMSCC